MFRWLYPAWILVCAILFVVLRGAEDPSRPRGLILSIEAGRRALQVVQDPNYEVVHVARSGDRWIVLVDKVPHTRLKEALVVELTIEDGKLLKVRKPVNR